MRRNLLSFIAGPELGLVTTVGFAVMYIWPFFAFDTPSTTFRFTFLAWALHIATIAVCSRARDLLGEAETVPQSSPVDEPPVE